MALEAFFLLLSVGVDKIDFLIGFSVRELDMA